MAPVGSRLRGFYRRWSELGDGWATRVAKEGVRLDLTGRVPPQLVVPREFKGSLEEEKLISVKERS